MNNFILLYGEVLDYPQQASIDKKGTEYYKFNFAVQRESGIIDILPIVVEEDTAAYNALADIDEKGEVVGAQLLITGEIRTRNIKDKLDISVRAFSIQEDDDYKGITNQVGGAQERRRRRVLRTNGNAGAVREGFVNGMDN